MPNGTTPLNTSSLTHDITTVLVVVYVIGVLLSLLIVAIPIILIVANRAEPDRRGLRPFTVYLFALSFLAILIGYGGSILIVTGVVRLFEPHYLPVADSVAQQCLAGAIIVAVAAGVLAFHLRRGTEIARTDERVDGPNARILHTYISAVSFVITAIVVASAAVAVYLVFDLIAPGVFGASDRGTIGRALLELVYVIVAGTVIVLAHLRYGPPRLLPGALQPRSSAPSGAPPMPPVTGQGSVSPYGQQQPSPYANAPLPSFAPTPGAPAPGTAPEVPAPQPSQPPAQPYQPPPAQTYQPAPAPAQPYQPAPPPPAQPYPTSPVPPANPDEPPGSLPPFSG